MEDKVHLETYYNHQPRRVVVDETPTKIKAQELQIVGWMLIKDQQLMKFNLGIDVKPQLVRVYPQSNEPHMALLFLLKGQGLEIGN